MDLFGGTKLAEPEPTTTVRLGKKAVQFPLRGKRREAVKRLMEILEELEGKEVVFTVKMGSKDRMHGSITAAANAAASASKRAFSASGNER
jgi:ribosomal protein L9